MMLQQEFDVFTDHEKWWITDYVLSSNTEFMDATVNGTTLGSSGKSDKKWNFHQRTVTEQDVPEDHPMMCLRLVDRQLHDDKGKVVSNQWGECFEKVFHRVREKMGLPFSHILRSSINLTWHSTAFHGPIHKDHYYIAVSYTHLTLPTKRIV